MSGDFIEPDCGCCDCACPEVLTEKDAISVMASGDSITTGGSGVDGEATGWRTAFWQRMRDRRAAVTMRGTNAIGVQVIATLPTVQPILADWRTASWGGYTLAQIDALATAAESLQGPADVYVLLGGENDLAAATPPPITVATIQASVATYINHRLAANPNAYVFVCTMTPHKAPCYNWAWKNALVAAFNADLPAFLDSWHNGRVKPIEAGSLLTASDLNASGNHPTADGCIILGRAIADAVGYYTFGPGPRFPRGITMRAPVPRAELAVPGGIQFLAFDPGTAGLLPSGAQNFSAGILFRPDNVVPQAYKSNLLSLGPALGAGSAWLQQYIPLAGSDYTALELHIDGQAPFVVNDCLRAGMWHLVAFAMDFAEGSATIYVLREGSDGKPETICVSRKMGVAAWNMNPNGALGSGAAYGVNGSIGLRGDVWVALDKVVTSDELEAWYLDGAIPAGVTALYPLNEGVGVGVSPSPLTPTMPGGSMTGTWSAAGAVPEPWNP